MRPIGLVARVELRRSWRQLTDTARGGLFLVGGLVFGLLYASIAGGSGFALARTVATGGTEGFGGTAFAVVPLGIVGFVAFLVVQRAIKKTGDPDGLEGLLTATDHRTVALGVVLAEAGRVLASIGVILVAGALGIAAGVAVTRPTIAGALIAGGLAVLVVGLSLVALLLAATAWSFAIGQTIRYVIKRSAVVSRHRSVLGIATTLVLVGAWIVGVNTPGVQSAATSLAAATPLGWWPHLVGVAVPGLPGDPLRGVAAGLALLGALLTGPIAVVGTSGRVWYTDAVQVEATADGTRWADRLLPEVLPTASAAVARKCWLRARRSPFIVQFAIFPYFGLIYQIEPIVQGDPISPLIGVWFGIATAVAAGAAFSLNPLGGEDAVLPTVLTSAPSGRAFVTGLALAGAIPCVVLTVAFVAVGSLLVGTAPMLALGGGGLAVIATLALPGLATGIGAWLPKFETNEVSGSEVVVPSGWAFGGYLLAAGVALAPGLTGLLARGLIADWLGVSPVVPIAAGLVLSTGMLAIGAIGSVWLAARIVEGYHLA